MSTRLFVLVMTVAMALGEGNDPGSRDRASRADRADPFGLLELPAEWGEKFWADPAARKLLSMSPRDVAGMVPVQAGLRFCRCPACLVPEREEPLEWSLQEPGVLKCRRCGIVVPNDRFPARVKDQVPEETIEVGPGEVHHYPYHAVEDGKGLYPDERLYLRARIDYEARRYLAQAALQAAVRARARDPGAEGTRPATLACVIILRFAQVYPHYAIHHDQPDRPKTLQPARILPPYRRGYQTAKWEWSGCLEVPLNLVMAYSLMRDSAALQRAGELLNDPAPGRTIERNLFRAAAEFARSQPREFTAEALSVDRGLLAVARVLEDPALADEARRRIEEFIRRGFYHDGSWREADSVGHRRILKLLDGWVARELEGGAVAPVAARTADGVRTAGQTRHASAFSMIGLARRAGDLLDSRFPEEPVRQASLPEPHGPAARRRPALLGGAGIAQLVVGEGIGSLGVEVRGQDSFTRPRFDRLALRLSAGGAPLLDDLRGHGPTGTGWELATPSHNVAVVDGLNQRESPGAANQAVPGSNILFFAADPDFQVASLGDPRAYSQSTTRYRRTVALTRGEGSCYALEVFEVHGGLQHDQLFHAAPHRGDIWSLDRQTEPAPATLLPATIRFLPSAPPEQGRWFVQAYGEFQPESQARLNEPTVVRLAGRTARGDLVAAASTRAAKQVATGPQLRLHLLGDFPATAITATGPEPVEPEPTAPKPNGGRASLILRRRSRQGETLRSTFVSVHEPVGPGFFPLRRVGRVESPADVVVVMVETATGTEFLLVNLEPGTVRRVQLPSGKFVSFDGLALRVRENDLALAGGTYAEGSGRLASMPAVSGTIQQAVRQPSAQGFGWFLTSAALGEDRSLEGRVLIVEHGDGTRRAWTINVVEPDRDGSRIHVREEPGFRIDSSDGSARYYQFPHGVFPGPHRFAVDRIAR